MSKTNLDAASRFLSKVLRHKPELVEIKLDEYGWVKVVPLIWGMIKAGHVISLEDLDHIVETNGKKRFEMNSDKSMIRASQGHSHSLAVGLDIPELQPPSILYHGTNTSVASKIAIDGIQRMNRTHVHLSEEVETANSVGARKGKNLVLLIIDAGKMYKDGYKFYKTQNNVWLTDEVPSQYIK